MNFASKELSEKLQALGCKSESSLACSPKTSSGGRLSGKNEVICERGAKKVSGYSGFYTCFSFDDDGNFLEMGAWE